MPVVFFIVVWMLPGLPATFTISLSGENLSLGLLGSIKICHSVIWVCESNISSKIAGFTNVPFIFTRLSIRDKKNHYLKLIPNAWNLIELRIKNNKNFSELEKVLNNNFSKEVRIFK